MCRSTSYSRAVSRRYSRIRSPEPRASSSVQGLKRVAHRVHVGVGADAGVAEEVPGAAADRARLQHGVRRARAACGSGGRPHRSRRARRRRRGRRRASRSVVLLVVGRSRDLAHASTAAPEASRASTSAIPHAASASRVSWPASRAAGSSRVGVGAREARRRRGLGHARRARRRCRGPPGAGARTPRSSAAPARRRRRSRRRPVPLRLRPRRDRVADAAARSSGWFAGSLRSGAVSAMPSSRTSSS